MGTDPLVELCPRLDSRGFFLAEASIDKHEQLCYYITIETIGGPMDFITNIWASKLGKVGVIDAVIIVIILIAT